MWYRLLADAVVVVHLLFVLYALLGGLFVLKWGWTAWVHLPAVAWGTVVEAMAWICPLTPLENSLRRAAGQAGYSTGFVEQYLLPILYPANLSRPTQWLLAAGLVAINVIIYARVLRRRKVRSAAD